MRDLLKPTFGSEEAVISLYSARAQFWVAFLGGPIAAGLFSGLNSKATGRLNRDVYIYLAFVAVLFFFFFVFLSPPHAFTDWKWLIKQHHDSRYLIRYGPKVIALGLWATVYGIHRQYHRAMALIGAESLNPWWAAIGCILTGGLAQIVLMLAAIFIKSSL